MDDLLQQRALGFFMLPPLVLPLFVAKRFWQRVRRALLREKKRKGFRRVCVCGPIHMASIFVHANRKIEENTSPRSDENELLVRVRQNGSRLLFPKELDDIYKRNHF